MHVLLHVLYNALIAGLASVLVENSCIFYYVNSTINKTNVGIVQLFIPLVALF